MAQTTDELLQLARARAFWPDGDSGPLTTDELLALLTAEHRNVVFPTITKLRQDYGVFRFDHTVVSGQRLYRMPPRAHASRIISLELIDGAGRAWKPTQMRRADVARPGNVDGSETTADASRIQYYILGNRIGLYPGPAFSGTLFVHYPLNPPKYVLSANCRSIATYNGAAIITSAGDFSTVPITTSSLVDIVCANGPGEPLVVNSTVGAVSTVTLTLGTNPPLVHGVNDIAAGDWVSLAGQSCIVSLPEAGFSALCDLLVARMHESQGDDSAYAKSAQRAMDGLRQVFELLSDRTDDEAETYIPETSSMWSA